MRAWVKEQRWEATDTGCFLTLVILMIYQWLGFQPANNTELYSNKFDEFVHLKPIEIARTLAGFIAPLALVWTIVKVAMQAEERSEKRKGFEQTSEAQTDKTIHALLSRASSLMRMHIDEKINWADIPSESGQPWDPPSHRHVTLHANYVDELDLDDMYRQQMRSLSDSLKKVFESLETKPFDKSPSRNAKLEKLLEVLNAIEQKLSDASDVVRIRIEEIELEECRRQIDFLVKNDTVWKPSETAQ